MLAWRPTWPECLMIPLLLLLLFLSGSLVHLSSASPTLLYTHTGDPGNLALMVLRFGNNIHAQWSATWSSHSPLQALSSYGARLGRTFFWSSTEHSLSVIYSRRYSFCSRELPAKFRGQTRKLLTCKRPKHQTALETEMNTLDLSQ